MPHPPLTSLVPLRDRFIGCLLGCAVGDALGAPYEGFWSHSIPEDDALLEVFVDLAGYPHGQYTDDTQLTAATVRAIVNAGDISLLHIAHAIAELWKNNAVVGPGGACTHAATTYLETGDWRTCGAAVGQAGNGTAMRTAPLGLFFLEDPDNLPESVANISRITHQDPRSIAGGVAIAKAAYLLATDATDDPIVFCQAIADAMALYSPEFAAMVSRLPALIHEPSDIALPIIAWSGMDSPEFDSPIITPFVIPTVLASLWCLLRHPGSWPDAVACAIRLGGDVDTLGAIVGALAGVAHGTDAIPRRLRETVLDSAKLQTLAVRYHALVVKS